MACFANCWRCWHVICAFSSMTLSWWLTTSRWRAAWFAFSGPRSRASAFGLCTLLRQHLNGWLPGGPPRMGPAPANPTAHRDEHGGAQRTSRRGSWQVGHSVAVPAIPSPLPGRWFGCPGAGTICACHRLFTPNTVLMSQSQFANPVQRERGPENGYPDLRSCQCPLIS